MAPPSVSLAHRESLRRRERELRAAGYVRIAGADEVGCGPLAGPLVAAAVGLAPGSGLADVDGSKRLSRARERTACSLLRTAMNRDLFFTLTPGYHRMSLGACREPPGEQVAARAGGWKCSLHAGMQPLADIPTPRPGSPDQRRIRAQPRMQDAGTICLLDASGVFEVNMPLCKSEFGEVPSTIPKIRPPFLLPSPDPTFSPGVGYFRRMARDRTQGVSGVSLTNDEYSAFLGWHPEGGPQSDFQFLRTNTFEGDRAVQDLTKDFGSVISQYHYRQLGLYYRGSYLNTADAIAALDTRQVCNALRGEYSQTFIGKRLLWNASGDLDRQDFRTVAEGPGGEVALSDHSVCRARSVGRGTPPPA